MDDKEERLKNVAQKIGKNWKEKDSEYFKKGETDEWLGGFWKPDSVFRKRFDLLDPAIIVELACGHGRHSEQMRNWQNKKILMDINQTNMDFCRKRFARDRNYTIIKNNGYDLRPLKNNSCTALFCYDSMVHFDSEVVLSYLYDIFRILKPGGKAFLHHSNYSANPGGDIHDNPGWRNYMSQNLFIHYSRKAGFVITDSLIISWEAPDTDCVTLLTKPLS